MFRKVPTATFQWPDKNVRRISVSNFGFGGTNAHIILEEAPRHDSIRPRPISALNDSVNGENGESGSDVNQHIYVFTANDKKSLMTHMSDLNDHLKSRKDFSSEETAKSLAFTLSSRRSILPWKVAINAISLLDLTNKLNLAEFDPLRSTKEPCVGFVFTGQGAQWHSMGRELMIHYPAFESTIEEASACLKILGAGWSLKGKKAIIALTSFPSTTPLSFSLPGAPFLGF